MFTGCRYTRGVNLFRNTHSNTVSLFAKQGPAKIQDKGLWDSMELLLIDVAQVYMNLLWFEDLLLMRLWVWNAYLVLLWNRPLAYPRALLHFGGPLSREFWQLTIPLLAQGSGVFREVLFRRCHQWSLVTCCSQARHTFLWLHEIEFAENSLVLVICHIIV